jgi:hypothetical protein
MKWTITPLFTSHDFILLQSKRICWEPKNSMLSTTVQSFYTDCNIFWFSNFVSGFHFKQRLTSIKNEFSCYFSKYTMWLVCPSIFLLYAFLRIFYIFYGYFQLFFFFHLIILFIRDGKTIRAFLCFCHLILDL